MKKQTDKITMDSNLLIILICSAITAITFTISCFLHYYKIEIFFITDMISAGFFAIVIGQIFIPKIMRRIKEKEENDCKYLDVSCKYQVHLDKTGIEQVYDNRKEKEKGGYYSDLFYEFNKLSKEHNSPEKPIKMIGVSLDTYFKNTENIDDLPSVIAGLCSSAYFKVMLCTLDNSELKTRLKFVNEKCKRKIKIKLDDTPIIDQIKSSKDCIEALRKKYNEHLECKQYRFSPYATIIIINEHIYYTPNVLDYLSYLPVGEQELRNKYGCYNAELSLCIKKNSEYGKRLVDLFDSLWENGDLTTLI